MDTSVSAVAPVAIRRRHCEIAGGAQCIFRVPTDAGSLVEGDPQLIYDPLHGIDERLWTLVLNTVGH